MRARIGQWWNLAHSLCYGFISKWAKIFDGVIQKPTLTAYSRGIFLTPIPDHHFQKVVQCYKLFCGFIWHFRLFYYRGEMNIRVLTPFIFLPIIFVASSRRHLLRELTSQKTIILRKILFVQNSHLLFLVSPLKVHVFTLLSRFLTGL